jgi:hypothetical protein
MKDSMARGSWISRDEARKWIFSYLQRQLDVPSVDERTSFFTSDFLEYKFRREVASQNNLPSSTGPFEIRDGPDSPCLLGVETILEEMAKEGVVEKVPVGIMVGNRHPEFSVIDAYRYSYKPKSSCVPCP